jgi:CBS domain-containing protein
MVISSQRNQYHPPENVCIQKVICPSGTEGDGMEGITKESALLSVKDLMKGSTIRVSSDGTLEDVLEAMIENDTPIVLVMDGEELLGMVGDNDIARLLAKGVDLKNAKTVDFITACMLTGNQPCVQIREEDSLLNSLRVMDLSNATHLVVVDNNDKVVGTLSVLDALRGWKEKD